MKKTWIVVGVLGLGGVALADPPYSFTTVTNVGDNVDIGGDTLFGVGQIAVNNQGDVGIAGDIYNANGADPAVLYSSNLIAGYSTSVALDGQNYAVAGFTPSQQSAAGNQFDDLSNIAISGTAADPILTFYGELQDATNDQGILQYDTLSGTTSDVAFQNDVAGYQQVGDDSSGNLQYQVNSASNVLFPAVTSTSQNVIQYGQGTPPHATAFTSGTGGVTQNIGDDYRMGVGADGTSAAVLFSGSTPNVYLISAPPTGTAAPISLGANYNLDYTYVPEPIVGYTSGVVNGLNQAVVIEVHDTTTGNENVLLSVGGGTPRPIIANEFTQAPGNNPFYGQLTPNGQFAAFIPGTPNTPTDTVQYGNLAIPSTVAATIASEAPATGPVPNTALAVDPGHPSLLIISLQQDDQWYPDVNSEGTVVFPALIGPQGESDADATEALLLWQPNDVSPQLVLSTTPYNVNAVDDSDTVYIDGEEAVVNYIYWNPLESNNDYFKSSLSDNYLAVDVDYTYVAGPNDGAEGNAVIITSVTVPEPGSIALLGVGAIGLMRRRRRRI